MAMPRKKQWLRRRPARVRTPASRPLRQLRDNIPADPCGGDYPQKPERRHPFPSANQWNGTVTLLTGTQVNVCGDLH